MSSFEIQTKIKHKAREQQEAISDFIKWQESIHLKDRQLRSSRTNEETNNATTALVKNTTLNVQNNNHLSEKMLSNLSNNDDSLQDIIKQSTEDKEDFERKKGNEYYVKKQYQDAIQCYSRCIALNSKSVLAYSNRGKRR